MQTFLPFESFKLSISVLDYRRLGKQRVEAMQIINSLLDPEYGYKHHPIKLLWRNHIDALKLYHNMCLSEWESRGYVNNMNYYDLPNEVIIPKFSPQLYQSHASNLLRKDYAYYSQFLHGSADMEYVWEEPISERVVNCMNEGYF
jgi:hypothetical protein